MSCPYKNLFGIPNQGVHEERLFKSYKGGFALVDILLTIAAALIMTAVFKYSFWKILVILIIISIVLHYMFCIPTLTNKLLGISDSARN